MMRRVDVSDAELRRLIESGEIAFGGNGRLRIYGTLKCKSGKRMKRQSRVFFSTEAEAIDIGFRPCGHCMRDLYNVWRNADI